MTLRGGRIVGTDKRSLSFVHQVPSNGEEHEKDSDDHPNIDAGHLGDEPRCGWIGPQRPRIQPEKGVLIGTGAREYPFTPGPCWGSEKKPRPSGRAKGRGLGWGIQGHYAEGVVFRTKAIRGRGDWFQKGKPRRSGAKDYPGRKIKMKQPPLTRKSRLF